MKWKRLLLLLPWGLAMRVQKNPVARVTDLLEKIQEKVEKQGQEDAKLWEQMQCNCKKTRKRLDESIQQEETRLPMLRSERMGLSAQKARLEAEKENAVAEKADAQAALTAASELRQKEANEFEKLKEELQKNVAAVGKAIAAFEKGLAGSFLQSNEADRLREATEKTSNLRLSDREALTALLSGEAGAPGSSAVLGALQSMRDTMEEDLSASQSREAQAVLAFQGMAAARRSEVSTLDTEIETKTSRIGELSVDLVNQQQAIDSGAKRLQDETKLLSDTEESCQQQEQEWHARSESRAEELVAIQETLKLLADDEARETFRKALPSESFLQLGQAAERRSTRTFQGTREEVKGEPQLALLSMAMRSGKIDLRKVQEKISEMIQMLKQEQIGEDRKYQWCQGEKRSSDENAATLRQASEDLSKIMDEVKADRLQAQQEVAALRKTIQDLDVQMSEALAQRRAEHREYQEALETTQRALELLERAKERLARFYASEKGKKSLLAQHRALARAVSGLQVASESSSVLPHEGFNAYEKQPGDVVLRMLEKIVADLAQDSQASEKQEKDAQSEYERSAKDAQEAREEATRSLAEKSGVKAGLEKRALGLQLKQQSNVDSKANVEKYLKALQEDCGELVKNYQESKARNRARQNRLENAKALLAAK